MALVLLNANAGGGRAARLAGEIGDWLRRHHPQVALHPTTGVIEARRVIGSAPRGSRVVIVGGDGSVHQMLPALLDGAHELALVSAGSGDDSARALGVRGLAWPRALSRALLAESTPVDIGWINTEHEARPFFSSLAAGFDAAVALRALELPAALRGLPRYLAATLAEVAHLKQYELRVEADGALLHEGPALLASSLNTPTYGGGMRAMPMARIDDEKLHLLLAGPLSRRGVLRLLPRLLRGSHLSHRAVRHAAFGKLQIDAAAPLPLAADGEPMAAARHVVVRIGLGVLRAVPGLAFAATKRAPGAV
jgi:diacylglycerol kinase family enzyme